MSRNPSWRKYLPRSFERGRIDRIGAQRRDAADMIARLLRGRQAATNQQLNAALSHALASLLPEALDRIVDAIDNSNRRYPGETRFSIMGALLDLPNDGTKTKEFRLITMAIERCLIRVQSDPAGVAWMAGDLIGDFWPHPFALELLTRVLHSGKARATGRNGAIHGLHMLVLRGDAKTRRTALRELREVHEQSRDRSTIAAAANALALIERAEKQAE